MKEETVQAKKKVYVETSVIGYLVARPSRDVIKNAWQVATREWWETAREHYELYTSPVVEREAAKGDADAAARRLAAIKDVQSISMRDEDGGTCGEIAGSDSRSTNQFRRCSSHLGGVNSRDGLSVIMELPTHRQPRNASPLSQGLRRDGLPLSRNLYPV